MIPMCKANACLLLAKYLDLEHVKEIVDMIIFSLSVLLRDATAGSRKNSIDFTINSQNQKV
jgi:hypothetical protein